MHDITAQSVLANIGALERAVELASTVEQLEREHFLEVHRILSKEHATSTSAAGFARSRDG